MIVRPPPIRTVSYGPFATKPERKAAELLEKGRCLVDGKEIQGVWYVDVVHGFVCTFDVLHDGNVATCTAKDRDGKDFWLTSDFPGREVDAPRDGVLSETLRGKVELFTKDGEQIA